MTSRVLAALTAALVLALTPTVASAHDPRDDRTKRSPFTTGTSVPLVTSPNARFVGNFPETLAISGEWARTGSYFYVSSLDSISVFDTSDPLRPKLKGTLPTSCSRTRP